ncbi:MAG: hypothetical protein HYV32_00260 [Candidatus Kerfeldbacteria bacterium]|nr:hypothetical protein [Candidatus Kerfeldbacteria bacterium]
MPINEEAVHTYLRKMNRLNTVLALLSLFAVLVLYGWLRFSDGKKQNMNTAEKESVERSISQPSSTATTNTNTSASEETTAELTNDYRNQVNSILAGFAFDDSATAETLLYHVLELRVPTDLKQTHLQIVTALNDAKEGNYASAQQRIGSVQATSSWFLPQE